MTVTRTPTCTVMGCPHPKSPEFHIPICGHGLEGHHHHVTKRSQGGKDGPQVFICPDCHDNIDNGEWGNAAKDIPGRGRVYFAWDLHGNTLIERDLDDPVLSDGAEARGRLKAKHRPGTPEIAGSIPAPDKTSAPSPSTKEESDEAQNVSVLPDGGRDKPVYRDSHIDSPSSPLTHEQRVAIAQQIKDTEWNRQWIAGDTANAWEAEMGQDAWQYLGDFGYQPESLSNIMNVCQAIPLSLRNGRLRFSHHVVVAQENREDMEMWLDKCEEEQWSVAKFRRQVKGTKPRVKKWSLEELRELIQEFLRWQAAPLPVSAIKDEGSSVQNFCTFLEEQA